MADWYHGVRARQEPTSVGTPIVAPSGTPLFFGTAPVHMVGGQVNVPVLGNMYKDAVEALGYSDNWTNYSLCQAIYSHYVLYRAAPAVFVNLLDPSKHKKAVAAKDVPLADEQCLLPLDAIKGSVKVKEAASGSAEYVVDEDYTLFYSGENLILEVLAGGSISTSATALNIAYDEVDPSMITKTDVIGGFDVATKKSTGLELVDAVFPKFLVIPDLLVCPGFSSDPEVAAVMGAKMHNINGIFTGQAHIDADSKTVTHYTDIPQWKKDNNIFRENQIVLWPKEKMADRTFNKSVQMAGLMAQTDSIYGCPTESPSNKSMQITATVLDDATDTTPATEVNLDITQANYLNQNGIVTALNFIGGFVAWGNETACYPANNDVKDYFINVNSEPFPKK
ncbi:MAG: phage tail protein [Oscillospiraceae bacterium]